MTTDIEAIAACGARIVDLEALVVKVEQQRNTMTAERDDLRAELDEVRELVSPNGLDAFDRIWAMRSKS